MDTTETTRFELQEVIRSHSLSLVLGKRLAIFLVVFSILITLVSTFSAVILLINVPFRIFDFTGISPLGVLLRVMLLAFGFAVVPGLFTYFTLPRIYDRSLQIKASLPADTAENRECNRKLQNLSDGLARWRRQQLTKKHADVFVSTEIESNVITYGNFDRGRIVFAKDVLVAMSHGHLRVILAHEMGHVEQNDFVVTCLFSEITRILNFIRMPFVWLCSLIQMVFGLLARFPLGIFRFVFLGIGAVLRFLIHLATMPLWLPRALLYWESQLAEYLADDFGVALGGSASGLITALMKLENMRVTIGRSGFPRRYDLFAAVVEHGKSLEANTVIGDVAQFVRELEASHPHSVRRWNRLARLGFLDTRIC